MFSDTPPMATGFAVFCIFLFCVLFITWCCKKLAHTKTPEITLVPSQGRYVSTIDVQTGLPVVIDVSTLSGSRRGRTRVALPPRRSLSCPINTRGSHAAYGSIIQHQTCSEVLPSTPPPAYSDVFPEFGGEHRSVVDDESSTRHSSRR